MCIRDRCYIANQTEEDQKKSIKENGSKKNLAEVWKFFCGIGKCSPENFKLLLNETQSKVEKHQTQSMLLHLHCAYESQQEWACCHVMETCGSSIKLNKQSLNPSDMTALGYVIVNSKTHLKDLALMSCYLGPEGLAALITEVGDRTLPIEKLRYM